VKNRFLMRIKNATPGLYRRFWLPMTVRDVAVIAGSILWEPTSFPAFWHLARGLPRALKQRREIMSRRRVSDFDLAQWFRFQPVSHPVPQPAAVAVEAHWKVVAGARTA